jgi:hypothetical protein
MPFALGSFLGLRDETSTEAAGSAPDERTWEAATTLLQDNSLQALQLRYGDYTRCAILISSDWSIASHPLFALCHRALMAISREI